MLPHEAASGVIEDGTHLNLDIASPLKRLLKQDHHILPLHTLAVESLGPFNKEALGQALLIQREREGEAERKNFVLDFSVHAEIGKTPIQKAIYD